MAKLSRIKPVQPVPAHQEPFAVRAAADTIPAPPPSSSRHPSDHDGEEPAPQSRLVDSNRRGDTIPAPPPDAEEKDPIPSTERQPPDAS
jgi:hypothetical protein